MKKILHVIVSTAIIVLFMTHLSVAADDYYDDPSTRVFENGNYTETYHTDENGIVHLVYEGNGKIERATWYETVEDLVISEGITEMGDSLLCDAEPLTTVTLPSTLINISSQAFFNCPNLKNITLNDNLQIIGEGAFALSGVESIFIPENVSEIGEGAFSGCSELSHIKVSLENKLYTDIDGVLTDKTEQTLIAYPSGKKAECYSIPDTIVKIDAGAFGVLEENSLRSIVIPKSVIEIEEYAIITEGFLEKQNQHITIYGYYNTAAETYAAENGFTFIALDEQEESTESTTEPTAEETSTAETTTSTTNNTNTTPTTSNTTTVSSGTSSPNTGEGGIAAVLVTGVTALLGGLVCRKKK